MGLAAEALEHHGKLLIVDDDCVLAAYLGKTMEKNGFEVETANSIAGGLEKLDRYKPDFALIDLRLKDGNGLTVVETLKKSFPDCRIVMLTAFGNIATAVSAVRAGAIDYISKPADAETVTAALLQTDMSQLPEPPEDPMTAERVRWEHIQRIYEQCGRNISETARRLKMHRRTLQRILHKYAPRDNDCGSGSPIKD